MSGCSFTTRCIMGSYFPVVSQHVSAGDYWLHQLIHSLLLAKEWF